MPPEMELVSRIQRLEKSLARMHLLVLLLFVACAGLLWFWKPHGIARVQATEFVLTDENGKILASLGHHASETCLQLGDRKPSSAYLCVGDGYGSSLFLSNRGGIDRVLISPGDRTTVGKIDPGFLISAGNGERLIVGQLNATTKLIVGSGDEANSVTLQAGSDKAQIRISGPSRKVLWHAP